MEVHKTLPLRNSSCKAGKHRCVQKRCGFLSNIMRHVMELQLVDVCCSYKGRRHIEDSQLIGSDHHLGVVLLQRSPRCLGQIGTGTHINNAVQPLR